jgi:hypothetical protein
MHKSSAHEPMIIQSDDDVYVERSYSTTIMWSLSLSSLFVLFSFPKKTTPMQNLYKGPLYPLYFSLSLSNPYSFLMTRLYILDVSPSFRTQPFDTFSAPLRHTSSSSSCSIRSSRFAPSTISFDSSNEDQPNRSVKFSKVVVVNSLKTVCLVRNQTPGGMKSTVNRHCLMKV